MNAMSDAEQAKLWEIVRDIPVALLTTDDHGTLRSRPMVAQQANFDGTLWFFTRRSSHGVAAGPLIPAASASWVAWAIASSAA